MYWLAVVERTGLQSVVFGNVVRFSGAPVNMCCYSVKDDVDVRMRTASSSSGWLV